MLRCLFLPLLVGLALSACGPAETEIQATVDAKLQAALATLAAQPTLTPAPTVTPITLPPSSTPQPTVTPQPTPTPIALPPTATPQPTPTPQPIPTLVPTATPIRPPPTATPQPTATPVAVVANAAAIYTQANRSVARISTGIALGSGVYIGDNLVLTAAHVILTSTSPGAGPVRESGIVVELDSQRVVRSATVVGYNRQKDVAILRLDRDPGVPALAVKATGLSNVGGAIFILGYPQGASGAPIISQGVISRFYVRSGEPPPTGNIMQYDAAIAPGSSGGPILDGTGSIISVSQAVLLTTSGALSGQSTGFFIGVAGDDILTILTGLKAGTRTS